MPNHPSSRRSSSAAGAPAPTFVLAGGEAHEWHGVPHERRELIHTSVSFVGSAYETLRAAGITRENIITIVQLQDYLGMLQRGGRGELTGATGIPAKWYAEHHLLTESKCRRLLEEGGATYDFEAVNPGTLESVLLGEAPHGVATKHVVPADSTGAIVFGIYSHGDSHSASSTGDAAEWFAHFPYESCQPATYDFVATEGARDAGRGRNRPHHYLYATQLRLIFHRIFARTPTRPVVGLLNYCMSGGNLDFMNRPSVRQALGVDSWPLFLMSSSQSSKESMVAGLWDAWFKQLASVLTSCGTATEGTTVQGLFELAEAAYYQENLYELLNAVKARVYVPQIWSLKFSFPGQKDDAWDPWHIDLNKALRRCTPLPRHAFSYVALKELQKSYESGAAFSLIRQATPRQRELLRSMGSVAFDDRSNAVVVWTEGGLPSVGLETSAELRSVVLEPFAVQLVEYSGTRETGSCFDLSKVVQHASAEIAQPCAVFGRDSGIASRTWESIANGVS